MKTITLLRPGEFRISDTPAPSPPQKGQVLVRVRRVGICGTDLHAYRGVQPFFAYPRILGHELAVTVEALGPDAAGLAIGQKCAVEPYLNCGQCIACRRGKPNCCVDLRVLGVHTDGGMCQQLLLPRRKLHPSAKLSLDQLALVETLGIGCHAVRRAALERDETVLVIGAGPIGLSVIQFAQAAAVRLIVMDVNDARLDFCRRHMQIQHTVNCRADPLSALSALTSDDLPTTVFDATGDGQSMSSAFRYVAAGGKLVFVGLFQGDVTFNDPHLHRRELTLYASRNSTPEDFAHVMRLMESGAADTMPWITHRCPADAIIASFPRWLDPHERCLKAVVEF
jgi:2-desacetyl-2-hydroxyethyl bacteriochlorophyllide A dehydrogenase